MDEKSSKSRKLKKFTSDKLLLSLWKKKQVICAAELGAGMMNVYIVPLGKGAGQGQVKRSLGITDV